MLRVVAASQAIYGMHPHYFVTVTLMEGHSFQLFQDVSIAKLKEEAMDKPTEVLASALLDLFGILFNLYVPVTIIKIFIKLMEFAGTVHYCLMLIALLLPQDVSAQMDLLGYRVSMPALARQDI